MRKSWTMRTENFRPAAGPGKLTLSGLSQTHATYSVNPRYHSDSSSVCFTTTNTYGWIIKIPRVLLHDWVAIVSKQASVQSEEAQILGS